MKTNIVAIVGRPNVGKSALFNRLVGKRISIVDPTRGVTRDRLFGTVTWHEKEFQVVDTGGIEFEKTDSLRDQVRSQTEAAIADACCILFLVDVTDGIVPLDREIMNLLRKHQKPVLIVVNKVDNDELKPDVHNFLALGVEEVYPISAVHGLGIRTLLEKVEPYISKTPEVEQTKPIQIVITGKPNVGKSSFLNAVLKEKRVIVDDRPGTTRDSIDTIFTWKEKEFILVDTAGMKRKKKVENSPEFYSVTRSIDSIERAEVVVLMIDAQAGPTEEDSKIADLAVSNWKGILICVNKWDLMKGVSQKKYAEQLFFKMPFIGFAPLVFTSALRGENVYKVIEEAAYVHEQLNLKIPTPVLNKKITEAKEKLQHPYKGRKRFKIYYVTQTGTQPPTIQFFVNDAEILDRSYEQYLVNQLRDAFGFEGAPLRLRFKNRR